MNKKVLEAVETLGENTPISETQESASECLTEGDPGLLSYHSQVEKLREELDAISSNDDPTQAEYRSELQQALAETQANFQGDWTLLELRRMLQVDGEAGENISYKKYKCLVEAHKDLFKKAQKPFTKKNEMQESYSSLLDPEKYDEHVAKVFLSTNIGSASSYGKSPGNLGVVPNGVPGGAVFDDAEHSGVPLNNRQKNIIEAHEKAHGLFSFNDSPMGKTLRETLDYEEVNKLDRTTYTLKPDEIHARMSQLRNYFGLDAKEDFTPEHLAVARKRYVEDTGLDNDMGTFLSCVTEKTQNRFVKAMNDFPM